MWLQDNLDIEVPRNGSQGISLTFRDPKTKELIDLSEASFSCAIAKAAGESPFYFADVAEDDLNEGLVTVTFNGIQIANGISGTKEIVTLAYDLQADYGNEKIIYARGAIILTPGVNA